MPWSRIKVSIVFVSVLALSAPAALLCGICAEGTASIIVAIGALAMFAVVWGIALAAAIILIDEFRSPGSRGP